jgi:DNA-binding XRE family transcriptional regulator
MATEQDYGTSELARDFGELTFGSALSGYRLGEDISQRGFAEFLGISAQSLCDIEKERRVPSVSRAARIAEKLGEPIAFFCVISAPRYT